MMFQDSTQSFNCSNLTVIFSWNHIELNPALCRPVADQRSLKRTFWISTKSTGIAISHHPLSFDSLNHLSSR